MIDNRIAEDVQLKLKPEHFFEPLHGRIYEAVMRLIDAPDVRRGMGVSARRASAAQGCRAGCPCRHVAPPP